MGTQATCNFVKQQGFDAGVDESTSKLFEALNFQPRVVGLVVLVALLSQSASIYLALSAVLWWSAFLPRLNPFDALHNALYRSSVEAARLGPAPGPRRFSMGMAGSFMLGIGILLLYGWATAAIVLQIFLALALLALLFGKLCLGSYIFHLLRGRPTFANCTLPWAKGQAFNR